MAIFFDSDVPLIEVGQMCFDDERFVVFGVEISFR